MSVNNAFSGTEVLIVKPLSLISLPLVPSKTAMFPATEEDGPTTIPSVFVCTIVQKSLKFSVVSSVPSLSAIQIIFRSIISSKHSTHSCCVLKAL